MIQLFRRPPRKRAGRRGRVVLRLEGLHDRAVPSGDMSPVPPPPFPQDGQPRANQPPQIRDFEIESMGGGWYMISGSVVDENPAGLTVTFGGSVTTLIGATVTTDAYGDFMLIVRLQNNGTDTGWVIATTEDAQGLDSNEESVYVDPT